MRVLITGNMGYVGTEVVKYLRAKKLASYIVGLDTGFFADCLTNIGPVSDVFVDKQLMFDVRDISYEMISGYDAIVHLAAISNDPMGKEFEAVTDEINRQAPLKLAEIAAKAGVKNFVFASSCSMYGASSGGARKESDPTNPLTAYARSKIGFEEDAKQANLENMTFTSLRFSTACGMSGRLRLDLVLNDFVATALETGTVKILSDGTPWRPLIDVEDMARAISWAIARSPASGGQWLAVNVGKSSNNYQVRHIAEVVAKIVPKTTISLNKDAQPDARSYQVDFSKFETLAPNYVPQVSLEESIEKLASSISKLKSINQFPSTNKLIRLSQLRTFRSAKFLSDDLRWRLQ